MQEVYERDGGEMQQLDEPDPFKLLPVEMWEEILGKYGDSRCIQQVLTAYPMMEGFVLKCKARWILDQIIPHIRPWLKNSDLLSCRLVCRKWSKAVDNFLENHPNRRAYNWEEQIVGQIWVPEASPEYWYHYLMWDWDDSPLKLGTRFRDFYPKMGEHPPGRNPFVGRSIDYLLRFDDEGPADEDPEGVETWNQTMEVLRKFGGEIWFLWTFALHPHSPLFYERLLTNLNLLPNLKSLELDVFGYRPNFDMQEPAELVEYLESRRELLPPLPHLETVRICHDMSPTLADIVVRRYSTQIRKLQIHRAPYSWKREYCKLFPNLTGLLLSELESHEEVTNLLLSLEAPDLYSLDLDLEVPYHLGFMNTLVWLLGRFKRLQCLRVTFGWVKEGPQQEENEDALSAPPDSVLSLKSLMILGPMPEEMDLNFLQFCPSLEYLHIFCYRQAPDCLTSVGIHEHGLWKTLPKLKGLAFSFQNPACPLVKQHCSRAKYEWLRKKEKELGSAVDDNEEELKDGKEKTTVDGDGNPGGRSLCSIV